MTNEIFALTANEENLQALVFEELDDSQASKVVGGLDIAFRAVPVGSATEGPPISGLYVGAGVGFNNLT
ncbi:MAG: hypothetical protein V7L05_11060 [Nostoc sp.]|uniref:hypothetical protein n=1 Tax=Nostoc sp. TaxID=1180 RepID=UPI002FF6A95C